MKTLAVVFLGVALSQLPIQQFAFNSVTAPSAARQSLPSQEDVDAFVRDVLIDALSTARFTDIGRGHLRYNVRSDLKPLEMRATVAALPDVPVPLTLMTSDEAQALAEQTGQIVSFIIIDITSLTTSEATIHIGTDIAMPRRPGQPMIKLCCCYAQARYTRQNARWTFVRGGLTVCA